MPGSLLPADSGWDGVGGRKGPVGMTHPHLQLPSPLLSLQEEAVSLGSRGTQQPPGHNAELIQWPPSPPSSPEPSSEANIHRSIPRSPRGAREGPGTWLWDEGSHGASTRTPPR